MNKLMAFFVFTFIAGSIIGLAFEGANGISSTRLTSTISSTDTTIPVGSVSGFLSSDYLQIGNETLAYSGKQTSGTLNGKTCPCFTGVTRGVDDYTGASTEAKAHVGPNLSKIPARHGSTVMNTSSSLINNAVGFNIAQQMSTAGAWKTVVTSPFTIMKTVVKLVAWDFAFLEGDFSYFKYILLYPLSAGFVATIIVISANTIRGIFG